MDYFSYPLMAALLEKQNESDISNWMAYPFVFMIIKNTAPSNPSANKRRYDASHSYLVPITDF